MNEIDDELVDVLGLQHDDRAVGHQGSHDLKRASFASATRCTIWCSASPNIGTQALLSRAQLALAAWLTQDPSYTISVEYVPRSASFLVDLC